MKILQCWTLIVAIAVCKSQQNSDLEEYLQSDDQTEYADDDDTTSCLRECVKGEAPRICYYKFRPEDYTVLSRACGNCPANVTDCYNPQCVPADGFERAILTVNRRLPGPSIQVCLGDRIIVDVENAMGAKTTTIHWHGILQRGTPYSDGVPMVTQCPIVEGNTFRYDFWAKEPGTYFWHSHDGPQKLDGLQGPIVIRKPREDDLHSSLYDYDLPTHVVCITDWYHTTSADHFPGLLNPRLPYNTTVLVNGRGRYTDPESGTTSATPYAVFPVVQGSSYRFRFIAALCSHCGIELYVQDHTLICIATDGNDIKPVAVDSIVMYSGERYDCIINATNTIGSYWIQVKGLEPCEIEREHQFAILEYEGSNGPVGEPPSYDDFNSDGNVVLNPVNASCGSGQNGICIDQLEAVNESDNDIDTENSEPDVTFKMTFGYVHPTVQEEYHNGTFEPVLIPGIGAPLTRLWINNIYQKTASSPILSQLNDIPSSDFCPTDAEGVPECNEELCNCIQMIKIPLGSTVDCILIDESDEGGLNHPFHLHGHAFQAVAMGYLNESMMNVDDIERLLQEGNLRKSPSPPLKDTIAVPGSGYAVIRFLANNPGYWFFHCHFLFHHFVGMSLVVQVGEPSDIPTVPTGFPKCGNYQPGL